MSRVAIALFVIPLFTTSVFFLPSIYSETTDLGDLARSLAMLPLVVTLYAWPGFVTFLLLGVPTLYLLSRVRRTGFLLFACIGAVYTALPWGVLEIARPEPRHNLLELVPMFAVIGLANGILTRLIVFGRR